MHYLGTVEDCNKDHRWVCKNFGFTSEVHLCVKGSLRADCGLISEGGEF